MKDYVVVPVSMDFPEDSLYSVCRRMVFFLKNFFRVVLPYNFLCVLHRFYTEFSLNLVNRTIKKPLFLFVYNGEKGQEYLKVRSSYSSVIHTLMCLYEILGTPVAKQIKTNGNTGGLTLDTVRASLSS